MRNMLISFKPEVFEKLATGKKVFEHRRVFPAEPIRAYIYVSRPVQAIKGIVYLGNRTYLEDWKEKYAYDSEAIKRIDNYIKNEGYKVVMEVQGFQDTSSISLKRLREIFPNFLIPQMYYYLDDTPLLEYLQNNLINEGSLVEHDFSNVISEIICVN